MNTIHKLYPVKRMFTIGVAREVAIKYSSDMNFKRTSKTCSKVILKGIVIEFLEIFHEKIIENLKLQL